MSGATILAGTMSAGLLTCGFARTAGAVMLGANLACIVVERLRRKP